MTEFIVTLAQIKDGPTDRLLELDGCASNMRETLKALQRAGIISGWKRNPRTITGEPNPFGDDEVVA